LIFTRVCVWFLLVSIASSFQHSSPTRSGRSISIISRRSHATMPMTTTKSQTTSTQSSMVSNVAPGYVSRLSLSVYNPTDTMMTILKSLRSLLKASFLGAGLAIRQSWWCFPMVLLGVPIYSIMISGQYATMPSWWALHDVAFLREMPVSCIGFLGSNIFYFLSGLFLLNRIPIPLKLTLTSSSSINNENAANALKKNGTFHTARYPMLGGLILASGAISLIYHAVQALGHPVVAESLCFVDHGLAFSSGAYFLHKCGIPSIKTLAIGLPSLALLAFPGDSYPVIHSLWHLTSACAAICWAFDGVDKRKKYISSMLQEKKGYTGTRSTLSL